MSLIRRQLFVGVLDDRTWTSEKLCAYLTKHASTNDDQYVIKCEIMSYNEPRFDGKSFAFVTFSDAVCVDRCMAKRVSFNEEYGITMKRLLPDTISKCERLMSTPDIAIRITLPDPLFTEPNIRTYFGQYGKILELKMLEEEGTGGICFITYEDFDSPDRVLIDGPHDLNNQPLSIQKYTPPEYICSLSQFRFIEKSKAHEIKRWHPILRNLHSLITPLRILYKTQLALIRYNMNKEISISNQNLNKLNETLREYENKLNDIKQNILQLTNLNQQLKQQIQDNQTKVENNKNHFEDLIEQQRQKNQTLQDAIRYVKENV